MKVIVVSKYGRPEHFHLKDVAKPTPKMNEVLMKIHAAAVNDYDWCLMKDARNGAVWRY